MTKAVAEKQKKKLEKVREASDVKIHEPKKKTGVEQKVREIQQKTSRTTKKKCNTVPKHNNRTLTITWDYQEAKLWYISNPTVTQKMVAEKYGISEATVAKKAVLDKWAEAKSDYCQMLEKEALANAKIKVRQTLDNHLKEARSLAVVGANMLQRAWNKAANNPTQQPDAKAVTSAARLIEVGHRLERLALGLPTSYQGFADKNGDAVDPTINLNIVSLQAFVNKTIEQAKQNGVIDVAELEQY
nr:MAG TPA: hypothetical protein [Caudoviricetes sp.]